jgi:RNA polymerase sigma-70 factor (ECF subfamily)
MAEPTGDKRIEGLVLEHEDAIAVLYDRFVPELFRFARMMLDSSQDAEDAVQEVFIGLVRTRQTLRDVANLRAYLFAALRRETARLSASRKARRSLALDQVGDVAEPKSLRRESEQTAPLERALRGLPAEQREVIALKIDGGLTFAEIACVLGISANTAASRYRYALAKLRLALDG